MADSDPVIWLYISEHLQKEVIEQYHDNNGHMRIDKTHDTIKTKDYWTKYVSKPISIHNILCNLPDKKPQKVKPPQRKQMLLLTHLQN